MQPLKPDLDELAEGDHWGTCSLVRGCHWAVFGDGSCCVVTKAGWVRAGDFYSLFYIRKVLIRIKNGNGYEISSGSQVGIMRL